MRIPCPYCGLRDAHEFAYLGDATATRPDPTAPDAEAAFHDYVYLRDNPAGRHLELWYHAAGCRRWLKVERDTRDHAIFGATLAQETPPGEAAAKLAGSELASANPTSTKPAATDEVAP